jgi:hypothetical protein
MSKTKVNKYIEMVVVVLAITLAVTISSVVAYEKAYAEEYNGNQAYSEANSCGNEDMPMKVQCSNTNSDVHGRDNTATLATAQGRPLISEAPDKIFDGFLTIKEAFIKTFGDLNPPRGNEEGGLDAFLKTHGLIPENGEGGAFGYGILTTNTAEGDGSLIVATTHAGVLDSATQQDEDDPIWHNHFVTLKGDATNCGTTKDEPNPAVDAITFKQPGDVEIEGKTAELIKIPNVFRSDDSLTGEKITLEPGNDAQDVVSFKLMPKFEKVSGDLLAVCVTDITSAEKITIE